MKSCTNHFKSFGFIFAVLSLLALGITGCASGGSSNTGTSYISAVDEGEIVVSLTDAAGDFAGYTVDVLSLNLTKANGAEVTTLPVSTRIDFAQYTEMTEFLTAATIPSGTYVAATMTLDFQNADIWVENSSGDNVQVTDIVDEDGNPITTLEVTVQLEDRNRLTIAPGIPSHLMIDFDLQASNQVDFTDPTAPVLTVDPFLVADVNRIPPHKIHRIRGLLNDVNLSEGTFSVILRPFYCALADSHRLFGIRSVMTDDDTVFHIDGGAYEGHDGLVALEGLDYLTPVVALGSLKFNPLRFEAWEVYAGTSVPGAGLDVVSGWVIERAGDTLTVKGASLIRAGSTIVFNDEVTVQVAESTVVTRQVSSAAYSKDDISIGQHITAFGTLTGLGPENLELDATDGMVRMMMTTVRGSVVSVDEEDPDTQLTVDLQSIGKFRVGNFDFTGTGETPGDDADPANYEVFTGTMDLSEVTTDTPVKLKGFAEPFGMAPPDFSAFTLIDVTDLKAFIRINWFPPTYLPFTDLSDDGLAANLEGTGRLHYLVRGSVVTDLLDLSAAPVIAPDGDGQGLYILKYNGVTEIHTTFENYVLRLEELPEEGYAARKLSARGDFDDSEIVLTADVIEIHLSMIP
ncbi:MAG: metallophosphoesterase [Acidobacteria bacterium]|nr:metallophosphoesterase [Acidobacteriota bacterium]